MAALGASAHSSNHVHAESAACDGHPGRRPGGGRGHAGHGPAVRLASRRRQVRQLPVLQPVRVLRHHLRLLRRRLPEPVHWLRRRRRGGVHRVRGPLRAVPAPSQRRGVPGSRVLHVRRLPGRRRRVPGLRHHRRPGHAEAGGGRLLRPDLSRDHRRVAHRARRPLLMGLLLQAGAGLAAELLRPERRLAVRTRQAVLWPRPHPAHPQLQLRTGRPRNRGGPAKQSGPGGYGPNSGVQDGDMVLDDDAVQQAVVP
ncbi:hypothetical protein ACQJBY_019853 [Aegilops geniculata]